MLVQHGDMLGHVPVDPSQKLKSILPRLTDIFSLDIRHVRLYRGAQECDLEAPCREYLDIYQDAVQVLFDLPDAKLIEAPMKWRESRR